MARIATPRQDFVFVFLLQDCAKKKDLCEGTRLHFDIVRKGLLETDPFIASTLISMYVKCGALTKAEQTFDELPVRNVVAWSALISGYAQQRKGEEALLSFEQMKSEGLSPDAITFTCILKACASIGALEKGKRIHDEIVRHGLLDKDFVLSTALVDMYAKCGAPEKAQEVLEELPYRTVVLWNALISGYIQMDCFHEAMSCFERMQSEGLDPNAITFTCILKACGMTLAIVKGEKIHDIIASRGLLLEDIAIGNALVDMYTKCGALQKAHKVLQDLPVRNVVTWSSLIAGYVQEGCGLEALTCFELMKNEGLFPNDVTFTAMFKACGRSRAVCKGIQIHNEILNRGVLAKDVSLYNALIDMYAKCGLLETAKGILTEFLDRDVTSWSNLISGYVDQHQCHEALVSFEKMENEGLFPNANIFISLVQACANTRAINKGKQIHDKIVIMGLLKENMVLGTALVSMYAKCGLLTKAKEVLDRLPIRDTVCWSILMAGYAQQEQCYEALACFERMQSEGLCPDDVTFCCILKVCCTMRDIEKGKKIHSEIVSNDVVKKNPALGTVLVDMYARCGMVEKAHELVKELPFRDVVSWSALIAGYVHEGRFLQALDCFEMMQNEGISPDAVSFICILKACGAMRDLNLGKKIHKEVINRGFLNEDIVLGTALLDMYAKCGDLAKAQQVLEELSIQTVVSWSALIAGYIQQGQGNEALECFDRMRKEGLTPDGVTLICVLKACSGTGCIDKAEEIHEEIVERCLLEKDIMLGNALVDIYSKCGMLVKAQQVLDELPIRNAVSWNTLIAGHARHGQCEDSLNCFELMQREGLSPDVSTFICLLKACGNEGAIDKGKQIHDEIVHRRLLNKDVMLANALIDMYAKCGYPALAEKAMKDLPFRDVVSWNALIAGYAIQGHAREALTSFRRMQKEGLFPNQLTFLSVLNACSHSGLIEEAEKIFGDMNQKYGISPDVEHQICMVIAYGNAGHFDKAMSVIKSLPGSGSLGAWLSLLGACKKWGNVKVARVAFSQAVQLDRYCGVAYALMADVFASASMHADAAKIEIMRKRNAFEGKRRSHCYSMQD